MSDSPTPPLALVAVVGSGNADEALYRHARDVGRTIGRIGAGLVCGGLGGVMEAAARGVRDIVGAGAGRTVGILPGPDPAAANRWIDVPVATGLGQARNVTVVLTARAVVAVGGESGTLSEIAHAWKQGRPVAGYLPAGGWGARLAGESVDGPRPKRVEPIEDLDRLSEWLREILPPDGLRTPAGSP